MEPWDFGHLGNVGLTLAETAARVPHLKAVASPNKPKRSAANVLRRLTGRKPG